MLQFSILQLKRACMEIRDKIMNTIMEIKYTFHNRNFIFLLIVLGPWLNTNYMQLLLFLHLLLISEWLWYAYFN
jgi:hypothetical protein